MATVVMTTGGQTLKSSYRVVALLGGAAMRVTEPTVDSGSLNFTVAGLPAGAKVTQARVDVEVDLSGGSFTLAGRRGTNSAYLPAAHVMENGLPVGVGISFKAEPTGAEEGAVGTGRLYTQFCRITSATLTLWYEGGSGSGGGGGGSEGDGLGQTGNLAAVKGPGRAGRGFTYFPEGTRNFAGNGMEMRPISALVTGEENGDFSAVLEMLMEKDGRWKKIGRRGIIRMPAPARQVLQAVEKESGESAFDTLTPSTERGYIYLYSQPTSLDGYGYNMGRVANGEKLVKIGEEAGTHGGTWCRVTWEKRGITGYCDAAQVTVTGTGNATAETVLRMQERDQLFRVDEVESQDEDGRVKISCRHIFYDLQKAILVTDECQMKKVPVKEALQRLLDGADHPVPFRFHTDCDGTVTGEYKGKNVVEALMDPEEGVLAQVGGQLMRDNFDIYILQRLGQDRGIRIEHGRNCEGAQVTFSSLGTANRIVAVMDDKYTVHDDPNRGEDEEILTVVRQYKKEDGTAQEQAAKEFENGLAGVDFEMEADFVLLTETGRYPQYAGLQQMYLGDEMRLALRQGSYRAKMRGYTYNSILRKYDEVKVGATSVEKSQGSVASYQVGGVSTGKLLGQVQGSQLAAESITTDKLAAGSVTAEKLAAGALTADNIAAGSITADKLAAGVLSADLIGAGSITTEKLAAGAVTADKIAGKTITADKMQVGLITADSGLISDSAIGTAQIADGSITEAKIVSLNADVIQSGTLQTDRLLLTGEGGVVYEINAASSGLSQSELTDAEYQSKLDGSVLVAKSVTAAQIAAEAITANEILSGAVTTDKLSANAVTTDKLAANSVTANKLASDVGSSLDLSSNNSVKLMVDDVRVGGTNLSPDTRLMESWAKTGGTRPVTLSVDGEGFGVLAWPADANKTWARAMQSNDLRKPYSVYRDKDVTVSFEFRGPEWVDNDYLLVYFYVDEGQSSYFRSASQLVRIPQTDAWKKITLSVTMTDDFFTGGTGTLRQEGLVNIFLANNCAGACEVRKFKVEIGNKATDWSPAPEDGAYTTSAVLDRSGIHLNTGGTFTVDSQNFDVDGEGKMTAKAGSIGGWEIAPGSLHSGSGTSHVRLSTEDATYAIWAGAEAAASAPFRVSRDGKVYLTKLYVTDENGNAQANPVNLSGSWWRTNRAVQTMAVEGNALTITLYDGTTVNFKKAAVSDAEIGGYNLENSTILVTVYDENGEVALEEALPDGGLMEEVYNTGWNECIDNCSYQSQAYYISEYAPGTLYMQVNGSYTSVGSGWVKTTRATGLYAIPGKKE